MQEWQEKIEQEVGQLREDVKHLKEQRTDEIRAVRVEVASEDVLNQLKALKDDIGELKIDAKAYTGDAAIFKNKVEHVESDVSTLKSDVGTLKTDVEQVKTDIDTIKTVQSGHSKFFEEHGKRLAATATKDDIARLEADITSMKTMQEQILKLLQQKPSE
jgi:archaellum component FlaC